MTSRTRNVGSVSQTIFRALDKMAAGSGLGTRLIASQTSREQTFSPRGHVTHESPMDKAVVSGDLKRVRELIRRRDNVNESYPSNPRFRLRGSSLLHLAIEEGFKDIALELLKAGAYVDTKDINGWTALHWACYKELEGVVKALMDRRCRLNVRDDYGVTPLMAQPRVDDVSLRLLRAGANCRGLEQSRVEELFCYACSNHDLLAVLRIFYTNDYKLIIGPTEEQKELFHHACREGNIIVAHTFLKNGCSVCILSAEEQEELLCLACRRADVFVVHTLLWNACSVRKLTKEYLLFLVNILSKQDMEELLRRSCNEGNVFAVGILLKNGCSVCILSKHEQEMLLPNACHEAYVFLVGALLKGGCSVSILSREEQEELLHLACREDDVFIAHTLLKDGCRVNILSMEEQEKLFHLVSFQGDVFVVHILLKGGCRVSILSTEEQERLLSHACCKNDEFVIDSLLSSGCDVNCNSTGLTPLMVAAENGHEELVRKLILEGANLDVQSPNCHNTVLHFAARGNYIQCGILLAEGRASVRIKNSSSKTPLDLASAEFKEAIKEALSFTTRKALCIIGNAESGKSTLIAALQAESNSFIGKIINRFRRVSDRRQRTAGIETVPHCSQKYGEVLFFDFAGQDDYHGPHQMFLESLLSKPGVSMTLLLVVKMTEEEDAILHQLHRWLTPVALMASPASPACVIIIGSYLDKVKDKEDATAKLTKCIEEIRRDLEELPLEFVGYTFLNCRQPQSRGIDQICGFLQEIPVPEFRATHTRYSLAWVLYQIRLSFTAEAVQLKEFSAWVQDNKNNLPRTMPPPEEVCRDLSAAGHALYLPNREDPSKSWLVLDLSSILHGVYGNLFSQFKTIVNEFGLIHCRHLDELLSGQDLDLEMVQQLLISLEFCLPVDPSVLKVDLSKLTQNEETSGWLFFPALISTNPPQNSAKPLQSTLKGLPQRSVHYLHWQLKTSKKHSISARLLQTILLRLAAHFVVKQPNEEGVQQHCCSIWWNGIEWKSTVGVVVTVRIVNNRIIQVIGANVASPGKSCQYLTNVIRDILSTVHRLSPKLVGGAYIMHPANVATLPEGITAPPLKELFPVEGIQSSIRDNEEFALSLKDTKDDCNMVLITDLFGGCTPSLDDIKRINWMQPEANQTQAPTGLSQPEPIQLPDVSSRTVCSCEGYLILFRTYVSRPSAGKGRAVLEGVGLTPETIEACYVSYPRKEEEAVQAGLIKWAEGHHGYSRTWRVLLDAMEYAGVAQHHCQGLKEKLYQMLPEMPVTAQQSPTGPNQPRLHSEDSTVPTKSNTTPGARALTRSLDLTSRQLIPRRFLLVPVPSLMSRPLWI